MKCYSDILHGGGSTWLGTLPILVGVLGITYGVGIDYFRYL